GRARALALGEAGPDRVARRAVAARVARVGRERDPRGRRRDRDAAPEARVRRDRLGARRRLSLGLTTVTHVCWVDKQSRDARGPEVLRDDFTLARRDSAPASLPARSRLARWFSG